MQHLSTEEIASILRSMIEHENGLFNQRVGWLIQIQGFLFAALSFAWDKRGTYILVIVFSVVGMAVSLASLSNMWVYFKATKNLMNYWKNLTKNDYMGPDIVGFHAQKLENIWLLPMSSLPVIFIIVWFAMLVTNLTRS